MREVTGKFYKSNDNKVFFDQNECIEHEIREFVKFVFDGSDSSLYNDITQTIINNRNTIINLLSKYNDQK